MSLVLFLFVSVFFLRCLWEVADLLLDGLTALLLLLLRPLLRQPHHQDRDAASGARRSVPRRKVHP